MLTIEWLQLANIPYVLVDAYISLYAIFQALTNRLKYSLDENDEKDIVNTEVIDEDKVASPLTPPTSVNE
jgi:hypothetical protein